MSGGTLGTARLVGKTELSGKGELASHGIYAHLRHPRYVGSLLAIVGACLIAGTLWMWVVAAVWTRVDNDRDLARRAGASSPVRQKLPGILPACAALPAAWVTSKATLRELAAPGLGGHGLPEAPDRFYDHGPRGF